GDCGDDRLRHKKSPAVSGRANRDGGGEREPTIASFRSCACLPGESPADEPLGVAGGELPVAAEAPAGAAPPRRAEAAVEVAVDLVAVFEAGQCIAFEVAGERAARAGLDAPAVGVAEAAEIDLLVGDARQQVGARRDLVVVAHADAPLVDIDVAV